MVFLFCRFPGWPSASLSHTIGTRLAENEFGGASLGDKRLTDRLVEIAIDKAMNPACTYSGVAGGNWPKVKAYYRLIDKPDDSAVTMSNILLPHREQTIHLLVTN